MGGSGRHIPAVMAHPTCNSALTSTIGLGLRTVSDTSLLPALRRVSAGPVLVRRSPWIPRWLHWRFLDLRPLYCPILVGRPDSGRRRCSVAPLVQTWSRRGHCADDRFQGVSFHARPPGPIHFEAEPFRRIPASCQNVAAPCPPTHRSRPPHSLRPDAHSPQTFFRTARIYPIV
jgi:hypothetical protein